VAVDLLSVLLWQMANDADADATAAQVYLDRLLRVVRENLSDPDLDASMLASTLGVSVRTVYSAFASVDATPARYIRHSALNPLRCGWAHLGFRLQISRSA
jgi:transcriptional regulator GlxA family with amidase domain